MDSTSVDESVSEDLPWLHVAVACAVIVGEAVVAHVLELGQADQLLIGGVRAFIQLSCLGGILYPIFQTQHPSLVLGYIFGFMILISAYEAAARPKVTYPGMFGHAVLSLGLALLLVGVLLLLIVTPTPWYNAQYLIPLAGMLINNSLSGLALALNAMLDFLTTRKEYVDVLLAFGATPWEASWPGFVKTVQAALIPAINGMNVIGLVSIPGMMTGQILGGATPMKAAKYQIVITFLISGCTFIAVIFMGLLTIRAFFDTQGRHDLQHVTPQTRVKVAQFFERKAAKKKPKVEPSSKTEPLLSAGGEALAGPLQLRLADEALQRLTSPPPATSRVLELELEGHVAGARPLRAKLSLHAGEVACIMGPSGIGKSTLLKWVSDLQAPKTATMSVDGHSRASLTPPQWRREVMYVHQSKAPLPDSPQELLQTIMRFRVNKGRPSPDVLRYLQALGLTKEHLDRPWSELSGGEAQRAMISIALALRPTCLLLDEPTSALDDASKRLVEELLGSLGQSVLFVTHDGQQAGRIANSLWQVIEE